MTKGDTCVDVHEQLAQIRSAVENARAMPMSASAVVNRAELLAQIDALAAELPKAFGEAQRVIAERDGVVAEGRAEAERIIAEGRSERDRLVSDTEVYRVAKTDADQLREEAQQEAVELRRETDEYVDSRLANFEVALGKTLEAVARGRERLHGRSDLDAFGREGVDDILLPGEDQP
jgi:regulator of protease activity HflC (stomatin/prohibitin superfamily)